MVPRIFREGICRPSKFRRPNTNVSYSIERNSSSSQPPDGVDIYKKYQKPIDYAIGIHQYDDPNILRPMVYIAQTTLVDTGKDGDKHTETLLESLQRKLASQQRVPQHLLIDDAEQQNEASVDEAAKAKADKKDQFSKDDSLQIDNVWRFAPIHDSDVTKDDQLLQKPELIRQNHDIIFDPATRPANIRHRYEIDSFDELAKNYLSMDIDEVDKRLLQDMERMGLPINTSEAMSPNINVSCEKEDNSEKLSSKPVESQQKKATVSNPHYYDKKHWCNLYFKDLSEVPEEDVHENYNVFAPDRTFHYDMLPLHFVDYDPFYKSSKINKPLQKFGFEEHDDMLPFHLFNCQDFTQLDLRVCNDCKIYSAIENIKVDETQPSHFALQGNLNNEVNSALNAIEQLEQYDFCTSSFEELLYGDEREPKPEMRETGIFQTLLYEDRDITNFDYTFPCYSTNAEVPLSNQHKLKTVTDKAQASKPIRQIEQKTMPVEELIKEKEHVVKPLPRISLSKPKDAEKSDAIETIEQKVEQNHIINSNVMEQVKSYTPENITQPKETLDRLVQVHPQTMPQENVKKPNSANNLMDVLKNTPTEYEISETIIQSPQEPNPKTVHLSNFINASVMKQVGAHTVPNNTTNPNEIFHRLNSQSLPNPELMSQDNIVKPNVAEQLKDVLQNVQKATKSNKPGTVPHNTPDPNNKEVELRVFINAKVMEQIGARIASKNTPQSREGFESLVQMNPHSPANNFALNNTPQPREGFERLVKMNPQSPANNLTSNNTPQPREGFERLVQMNPQSPENNSLFVHMNPQSPVNNSPLVQMNPQPPANNSPLNIIHDKIMEQVRAPPPKLKHTTDSVKGIHSVVQMQPQAAPETNRNPPKATFNEPLKETMIYDHPPYQETATHENTHETFESLAVQKLNTNNEAVVPIDTLVQAEKTRQPSRGTETMVQSCVQTTSTPTEDDDTANKLKLDLNLSLSELLRRVRARNRLQYLREIKEQFESMSVLYAEEKRCPPSDRPQCPPPPECSKPCPPPPKSPCPPPKKQPVCPPPKKQPVCPPPKKQPVCPPAPKCPPEPPKCPPPKVPPKCPPDPPKCPPDPPKCPPEPKCPCPCPPPPKCPPAPPKCPCQSTDFDEPVAIPYLTLFDTGTGYLRSVIELVKKGFLESKNMLFPGMTRETDRPYGLKLNRIKDFEPWTPVPSWPFPVEHKKRKLQCPYHGCPYPKPGPVRPNCPELPCTGFPKRLTCSDTDIRQDSRETINIL